jgi:hypothetical protein
MSTQVIHPEQRKINSLTSHSDFATYKPREPPLNDEQTVLATKELNNNTFITNFPDVERMYTDPIIPYQKIGLFSFVPAKGAKPNKDGLYGMGKLRGNYDRDEEASQRAEYIIRNVDSYHQCYHFHVGRPFPVTVSSEYSENISRIDLRKDMKDTISEDVKGKRMKEEEDIAEIQKRQEELLADTKRTHENDPTLELDEYITLRVKKAQLSWTWLETDKKMKEMQEIILKTNITLSDMELKNPNHKEEYFQKYMNAREHAGLSNDQSNDNFIKFMCEDAPLPFL